MSQRGGGFPQLTGVVSVVLLVPGFALLGGAPAARAESADELVAWFTENSARITIGSLLFGLGAVVFLFFVGSLWRVLRSAEGPAGWLSGVTLAGGAVATVGMLMFAGFGFVLAGTAKVLDPAAVQAIQALNSGTSPSPLTGGMAALLFASGLVIIRTGALPRWLGWVAVVLAAGSVSPAGFAAFLASLLWIIIVSILLARRSSPALVAPDA